MAGALVAVSMLMLVGFGFASMLSPKAQSINTYALIRRRLGLPGSQEYVE